jgi:hypothetical protein
MNRFIIVSGAITFAACGVSLGQEVVYGPPVRFRATDIHVPAPSTEVLHLTTDVYVETTSSIRAEFFGMLFDVAPRGVLSLVGASAASPTRPPLFPPHSEVFFVAPAASGNDAAAIGIVYHDVTEELPADSYGLFTLHVDVPPLTAGTFELLFNTNPLYSGVGYSDGDSGTTVIYPNVEPGPALLATITIESWSRTPGDIDGDGLVTRRDAALLATRFGSSTTPGDFDAGDFSGDGLVGTEDLGLLQRNFGAGFSEAPIGVPEPTGAAIGLTFFALASLFRRRRFVVRRAAL